MGKCDGQCRRRVRDIPEAVDECFTQAKKQIAVDTVSYTHLDVYKRQTIHLAAGIAKTFVCASMPLSTFWVFRAARFSDR